MTAVEPAPPSVESNGPVGLEAILTLEQLTSRRSSEEDVTTLTPTNLGDLAAAANREHLACEQAYASAIEHAFRTGEHLLAAKKEGEHGQWIPWLERHFVGSYRTAAGYMRLARTGNVQRVADLSLRDALQLLAKPRESGPTDETEEVDAKPATTPSASIFDRLRAAGDLGEAETALRRENARRAEMGFPRSGMERKTFRDIHSAIAAAQRSLDLVKRHELSNWSRAEALDGARMSCARPASWPANWRPWCAPAEFSEARATPVSRACGRQRPARPGREPEALRAQPAPRAMSRRSASRCVRTASTGPW